MTGTIDASDVLGGAAAQGLAAGEFGEFVDALQSGATYVNVHTNDGGAPTNTGPGDFPGGEIRGQVGGGHVNH